MAAISKLSTGVRAADIPERQHTAQLSATLANGAIVQFNATNGTLEAASDVATPLSPRGVLLEGGVAGEYRTMVERGKIAGFDVSALNHGVAVYAGASGALDTATGASAPALGRVIPATANAAQPHDKIVQVG
jgi:hypothetical protein